MEGRIIALESRSNLLAETQAEHRARIVALEKDVVETKDAVSKNDERSRSLPQTWIGILLGLAGLLAALTTLIGGGKVGP